MINYKEKKYVLAIETTSKICGVAIANNDSVIYENNINNGLNHSVTLFDNICSGLNKLKINFNQFDKIKVSSGPGSFTGIRIGIATALGLSYPYNTPIEYIDTLDAQITDLNNDANIIISMIDARANRVYAALYDGYTRKKLLNDFIIKVDDLIALLNKHFNGKKILVSLIGDGANNYKAIFKNSLQINYKIINKFKNLKSSYLINTKGKISKKPIINYMLASKAEREYIDKN